MQAPLGIGVVGCGSVLAAYAPLIERLDYHGQARLVMACDRDEAKRNLMAEQHHVQAFTTEYQQLVESPQVDVVLILTSMLEHARIASAALQAGKHVLVEKPMATDLDEAAELLELAKRGPGLFLPAPFVMLSPTCQAIARHIQRGDIGAPLSARARYGWSGPWWSKWFYQSGGGAIFDLAPYNLTSLTGLLGPVRRVSAMTGVAIPQRQAAGENLNVQAEDNAQILLDFGGSTFAVVTAGFTIQQYRTPALEVYGSQGTVQMLGDDWDPDGFELWQNDAGAWQVFKETDPNWSWCDGLNHLVQCLQSGQKSLIQPEQAYHVLEIMLRAQESGRDGQTKEIHSTFAPVHFSESGGTVQAHLIHDRTHH
jgi:predicted dehydrogenase